MIRDEVAEQQVIGALLNFPEAVDVFDQLEPEDFGGQLHQEIYRACKELGAANQPIDLTTVKNQLEKAGLEIPYTVLTRFDAATAANIDYHAKIVVELARKRALAELGAKLSSYVQSGKAEAREVAERVAQAALEIADDKRGGSIRHIREVVKERVIQLQAISQGGAQNVSTGFGNLDGAISGLAPGRLYILAGRPGMGKTAFAFDLARNVAKTTGVLVFSLEMPDEELADRMAQSYSQVPAHRLSQGIVRDNEWAKLFAAYNDMAGLNIYLDGERDVSLGDIRIRTTRLNRKHPIGLVIVDYLQLLRGEGNRHSREREVAEMSRGLKMLALGSQTPVVCLSQLGRGLESRGDRRPLLSDLRESGAIEQDADVVMMIYREDAYRPATETPDGVAELLIRKNRSGPTKGLKFRWVPERTTFREDGELKNVD